MEELLNALQNADGICGRANIHLEKAAQCDGEAAALEADLNKKTIIMCIAGVAVWLFSGLIGNSIGKIPVVGGIFQFIFSLGVIGIIVYFVWMRRKALNAKLTAKKDEAAQERAQAQQIFDENGEALAFLPSDYWYPLATSYLVKAVATNRVAGLAEALDKFDEQLHRWKVEEANASILAQQEEQTAYLKSIKVSNKVNAAANISNVIFNIASRL